MKFLSLLLSFLFLLNPLSLLAQPNESTNPWTPIMQSPSTGVMLYQSFTSDAAEDAGKEIEVFVARIESAEEEGTLKQFVLDEIKDARLVNPETDVSLMYLDRPFPKRAPGQETPDNEQTNKEFAKSLATDSNVGEENIFDLGKDFPVDDTVTPEAYRRQNRIMTLIRFSTNGAVASIGFLIAKEGMLNTYESLMLGVITGAMSGFFQLKNKQFQQWLLTGSFTEKKTLLAKAERERSELFTELERARNLEESAPIVANLKKSELEIAKLERAIEMEKLKAAGEKNRLRQLTQKTKEYLRWYLMEVSFASVLISVKSSMVIGLSNVPNYLTEAINGNGAHLLSMLGTGGHILEASFYTFLAQGFWDLSIAKETQTLKALKPWLATTIQNRANKATLLISMLSVLGLALQIGEVPYAETALIAMGGTGLLNYIRVEAKERPGKIGSFIRNVENKGAAAIDALTGFGKKIVRGCKKLFSKSPPA